MRLSNILVVILLLLIAAAIVAVNPAVWVWLLFGVAVFAFVGMLILSRRQ